MRDSTASSAVYGSLCAFLATIFITGSLTAGGSVLLVIVTALLSVIATTCALTGNVGAVEAVSAVALIGYSVTFSIYMVHAYVIADASAKWSKHTCLFYLQSRFFN